METDVAFTPGTFVVRKRARVGKAPVQWKQHNRSLQVLRRTRADASPPGTPEDYAGSTSFAATEAVEKPADILTAATAPCTSPRDPVLFLDNATSTIPLELGLRRMHAFYTHDNSDASGAACSSLLSKRAFDKYESSREAIRGFLNAESSEEIVFTGSITESVGIVAYGWAERHMQRGDEILVCCAEHGGNVAPWQVLAERIGAKVSTLSPTSTGVLPFQTFARGINARTRLIVLPHVNEMLGVVNEVRNMIAYARRVNAKVFLDASQSVPHMKISVKRLGCDFLVFSGEKVYAPSGISVLYARGSVIDTMKPFMTGGETMFDNVTESGAQFRERNARFEVGTPSVALALALATACVGLRKLGSALELHSRALASRLRQRLEGIAGLDLYGPPEAEIKRLPVVAFNVRGVDAQDLVDQLAKRGIQVEAGRHACRTWRDQLGVDSYVRASFGLYNTFVDVDRLVDELQLVCRALAVKPSAHE